LAARYDPIARAELLAPTATHAVPSHEGGIHATVKIETINRGTGAGKVKKI